MRHGKCGLQRKGKRKMKKKGKESQESITNNKCNKKDNILIYNDLDKIPYST